MSTTEKYKYITEFCETELFFGLVSAIGTNLNKTIEDIGNRLQFYGYQEETINISNEIIKPFILENEKELLYDGQHHALRYDKLMTYGNLLRAEKGNAILAEHAINLIHRKRREASLSSDEAATGERNLKHIPKKAYILKSLKNKEEVETLRSVYGNGFYLIGVHETAEKREEALLGKGVSEADAKTLIERDANEKTGWGQHVTDAFQLADFFIDGSNDEKLRTNSLNRFIDLVFGNPHTTPTFGEYAMFMAHSSSLRSSDPSRQIGATVCKNDDTVVALGANEVPKYSGGLYWTKIKKSTYYDDPDGKDYTKGYDPNKEEIRNLAIKINEELSRQISTILNDKVGLFADALNPEDVLVDEDMIINAGLNDITEYGRVVHAEMDVLTTCARNGISTQDADMYVTTFPCHNCAKHIIAAGIKRVVYIEPYEKSKALTLFNDSIISESYDGKDEGTKVVFTPFFGIGPRRYLDFFAKTTNYLPEKIRKDKKTGKVVPWVDKNGNPVDAKEKPVRSQLLPYSYIEQEVYYSVKMENEMREYSIDYNKLRFALNENEKTEQLQQKEQK